MKAQLLDSASYLPRSSMSVYNLDDVDTYCSFCIWLICVGEGWLAVCEDTLTKEANLSSSSSPSMIPPSLEGNNIY